jgi:long-chain acyl-CoA synthetase
MKLSEKTINNIYKAHIVRDIKPDDYRVKYNNIFELLEYRAKLHANEIYISFYPDEGDKVSLTYKQFSEKVFQTANLLSDSGIGAEDRIAAVSHNHINTVIQYFAAWSLGATVVPINVNEEPERIKYILSSSGTKLAFVHHQYTDKILSYKSELSELTKIFVHGSAYSSTPSVSPPVRGRLIGGDENLNIKLPVFEEEISKHPTSFTPSKKVNRETEALIVYTSGTTGLPKGVVLTQHNLMSDADGISKWHKMTQGEAMMCVLPIHHVNGTVVTIMTPIYYGGRLVLNQKFHTHKFFERIVKEKVGVVSVVPTLLQFLTHDYSSGKDKDFFHVYEEQLPLHFRHIICGAGPLTCELACRFEDMFGMKIIHGYGLSETTCYSCFLPLEISDEEHRQWLESHGFPSIGVEIEPNEMDIQNDKGESIKEGERGEIVIRGHNVMKYYDQNPEANDKTFEFGWFRSGDEGFYKKDDKGRKYFFITGRIKELIIRGGINIAPLEIDEVLCSIPDVKAGIAVGFDNDWYGEEVGALVTLKSSGSIDIPVCDLEELKNSIIKHCREKLPFYKCPKVVVFSDTIPVTSTGKYQRNKVKSLFAEWKTVQFKGK